MIVYENYDVIAFTSSIQIFTVPSPPTNTLIEIGLIDLVGGSPLYPLVTPDLNTNLSRNFQVIFSIFKKILLKI